MPPPKIPTGKPVNKVEQERIKRAKDLWDYRMGAIRKFMMSCIVGGTIALPPAYFIADGIGKVGAWGYQTVFNTKLEEVPGEIKKIDEKLKHTEEEVKKGRKWKERIARLGKARREGRFWQETVPGLKMQKSFYEGTQVVQDVLFWTSFASWWLTFFSLSSTFLYRYLQTTVLKKEQIENNLLVDGVRDDLAELVKEIEDIKSGKVKAADGSEVSQDTLSNIEELVAEMVDSRKLLQSVISQVAKTGALTQETIKALQEAQPHFKEAFDSLKEPLKEEGLADIEIVEDDDPEVVANMRTLKEALEQMPKIEDDESEDGKK